MLRVYAWLRPTLSFGCNQTARGCYDLPRIRALDISMVRRPTGGRAILHHREVAYSVTAPASLMEDLRCSYARINALLVAGLRALGAHAQVAPASGRSLTPAFAPCFAEPAAGELVVDGRKLAGSAQWRADGALLQHGSILVDDDQSALTDLAHTGEVTVTIPRPATLVDALGRAPSPAEVADALLDAVRLFEDPGATELQINPELRARTSALVVRYLDDGWTWRR